MVCDLSGAHLRELTKLTNGEAVGINIPKNFSSTEAIATAGPRVTLQNMDGMNLQFPDNSFDLVVSSNVLEHVPDPCRFIIESARVLKPSGLCSMETAPAWSIAREHYIIHFMIKENLPHQMTFRECGSITPFVGPALDRHQMTNAIRDKVLPNTLEYILWHLYDSGDLNRTQWRDIQSAFRSTIPHVKLSGYPLK